jgi:hypothetical protein
MTTADELEKLHRLQTQGVITAEEFAAQKAKLIGGAGPASPANPAPRVARKISVLAILAFVLSFILGPLGSVLGVVAIIVVATSKGKLRGIGFGIGAICVGFLFWGILAAIAIPAFLNYMKMAKSSEATLNIDRMYEGAVTYWDAEHIGPSGEPVTHRLPPSTEWTPATSCCEQGGGEGKCDGAANAAAWSSPTWRALGFAMADNFYYQYRFTVEGDVVYFQARGDLDCDGTFSLFERSAEISPDGTLRAGAGITKNDPTE